MSPKDFTVTLLTDKTLTEVFAAINKANEWWPGDFEGKSGKLNDEFTYRYQEFHFSKQRVTEFIPDKKVVWLVTESKLNFIQDKEEWTGTKIQFELETINDSGVPKTQLVFTHHGLHPQVECHNDCSNAWSRIVQQSFQSYLNTGKGINIFEQ